MEEHSVKEAASKHSLLKQTASGERMATAECSSLSPLGKARDKTHRTEAGLLTTSCPGTALQEDTYSQPHQASQLYLLNYAHFPVR